MEEQPITPALVEEHNLTAAEYERIVATLGRTPTLTELGIFSVMWSEHCSYKSSRVHLRRLPTRGPCVIQGPGENAGVVDIGEGEAAVFKIESHNHPSFIEPYQGAATGVGGIIRDIFTMGARPIACLDSLRFGPLLDAKNRFLLDGVVAGIAGYGNCIGIPTVGGEVYFDDSYSLNPLVNVLCLGVARRDQIFYGKASGVGNPVIYVGARTGRDGIHGATMASAEFDETSQERRPTVQVGDPFQEKLLLEACLEAFKTGAVLGIQDMGAAGLTCSTCEMGARGGVGVRIELDRVPQREEGMTPYEIMLSESQERMLMTVAAGREGEILEIFRKWDLEAAVIGEVIADGVMHVEQGGRVVARIPNTALTDDAPVYERPLRRPAYLDKVNALDLDRLALPGGLFRAFKDMLAAANLCSRRWIYQQYDHMVRTNTALLPGADAAVLRLKGRRAALAVTTDGNGRYTWLDPRGGAMIAVAEACRNLVCAGARPLAATNCLNFASPEDPEVMWTFSEVIDGIAEACAAFGTPITGGNVSFYNETLGKQIMPTPVIGMLGVIDDVDRRMDIAFKEPGHAVLLLGETLEELGGTEYLELVHGLKQGPIPRLDLRREANLQGAMREMIGAGLLASCHDVSEGGLAMALADCCFASPDPTMAVEVTLAQDLREDAILFGESQSRAVVSAPDAHVDRITAIAAGWSVPCALIGRVSRDVFALRLNGHTLVIDDVISLRDIWTTSLETILH
ncbi:MAG TPA: phosphoribosylformylglycinamidine synthase subunit PurL [Acidobacteriota bacterium]|nr:phosphoribosylformylglycinamidine synthase subunit PurL [Acidobacteriota bacterium]